jgi:hypothetical protein
MKKILILILCFSSFISFSQNQPKTAYERRKDELTIQLLKQFGITQAQINRAKEKDVGGIESLFMLGNFINKLNTMEGLVVMERFNTALKKAEGLKTEVDFRREREKKDLEEKERQIAIERVKEKERLEEEEKLENQKKEDEAERQRQREDDIREETSRKQEKYEKSDFVAIKKNIKDKFGNWLEKGEFEKTEDYQNRIKTLGEKTFDSISIKSVASSFGRLKKKEVLNPTLSKYDADKESFTISFSIDDYNWTDVIKVPIKDAVSFKENFYKFKLTIEDTSWCFVDNYLYPSTLIFTLSKNSKPLEFTLPQKNKTSIYFTAQDLGFHQDEVKDIYFDYNLYNQKKQRADSIVIENLFLITKNHIDNNNFNEAKENIEKAKTIRQDERFEKLEDIIPIKIDSLEKVKRIEYLTMIVSEYDSLTKLYPQNTLNLEKSVFKKYKFIALSFNYYKDSIVRYNSITWTEKTKDDYIQSAINNENGEKNIKDGLESVKKLVKAQEKISKLGDDKLKDVNSNFKRLKDNDTFFKWEVKKIFED